MADSRRAADAAAAEEEAEAAERAAISFAAPAAAVAVAADVDVDAVAPTSTAASLAELEAERALHRRRAERFGGEFVDPVSFLLSSFFRERCFPPPKRKHLTLLNLSRNDLATGQEGGAPARRGAPRAPGAQGRLRYGDRPLCRRGEGETRDRGRETARERGPEDGAREERESFELRAPVSLFVETQALAGTVVLPRKLANMKQARIAARAARFGNIAPSSANAAASAAPAAPPPPLLPGASAAAPVRNVLTYAPDEDELKKRARAARFQTAYDGGEGLMDVDLLEERRPLPPPGAVARRPEAVYVYGVDVLSTSDLLRYFSEWGPTFVEWLDDSSANVVFADELTAKRALVGRGRPLPPPPQDAAAAVDASAAEGGVDSSSIAIARLDPTDIKNAPFLWHKGDDAIKAGTAVPIVYRMATVVRCFIFSEFFLFLGKRGRGKEKRKEKTHSEKSSLSLLTYSSQLDVKPPKGTKVSRGLWRLRPSDALSTVRKGGGGAGKGGGGGGRGRHSGSGRGNSGGRGRRGNINISNNNNGGDVSMSEVLESAGKVTTATTAGGGGGSAE